MRLVARVLVAAPVKPPHALRQWIREVHRQVMHPLRVHGLVQQKLHLLQLLVVPALGSHHRPVHHNQRRLRHLHVRPRMNRKTPRLLPRTRILLIGGGKVRRNASSNLHVIRLVIIPVHVQPHVVVHRSEVPRQNVGVRAAAAQAAPSAIRRPGSITALVPREHEAGDDSEEEEKCECRQDGTELPPPVFGKLVPPHGREGCEVWTIHSAALPLPDSGILVPIQQTQVLVLVFENVLVVVVREGFVLEHGDELSPLGIRPRPPLSVTGNSIFRHGVHLHVSSFRS
mmetsp:Transcript_1543/g.4453  ORF Transcript_1543/g.4453 Transcript_1543/m.4453 type:complete len:285 (-) Transcript_1543:81-935(-)